MAVPSDISGLVFWLKRTTQPPSQNQAVKFRNGRINQALAITSHKQRQGQNLKQVFPQSTAKTSSRLILPIRYFELAQVSVPMVLLFLPYRSVQRRMITIARRFQSGCQIKAGRLIFTQPLALLTIQTLALLVDGTT